ncbi:MAG TPA: hypothetical protein VGG33_03300 [Polyangia bacterium]
MTRRRAAKTCPGREIHEAGGFVEASLNLSSLLRSDLDLSQRLAKNEALLLL